MITIDSNITFLINDRGEHLHPDLLAIEPRCGSVVLTEGLHGTAWQRHFSTGRWHPTRGGGSKTWADLITKRNLVLVYSADERMNR